MSLLIQNGTVVTPTRQVQGDIWCDDGRIVALLPRGQRIEADSTVDASGMLLFPGFIDPHVHSREPGLTEKEDFSHSTRGAAVGGTTTVLEMPNTVPPVMTGHDLVERAGYFSTRAWVDYGLWGLSAGTRNTGDIEGLFAAGAVGVKLFWGYALDAATLQLVYTAPAADVVPAPDAGAVWQVAAEVARVGGVLALHCEDRSILDAGGKALGHPPVDYSELLQSRPEVAETAAVAVAAEIAGSTGCHVHVVHMSSGRAVDVVRAAHQAKIPITAETCPHYLTLTSDHPAIAEGRVKVFPLVKGIEHQQALWRAIGDCTIVSIGSDHAPHTLVEKSKPLAQQPAGMVGVETLGPVMVDAALRGMLAPEQLAYLLAESPARLYGLFPRKGTLAPGSDADITVVDPHGSTTISNASLHAKNPSSPWEGQRLQGRVAMTFVRGQLIAKDGQIVGGPIGRFVPSRDREFPRQHG